MGCKYSRSTRTFDAVPEIMKYVLTLALCYALPAFSQWFASAGGEYQVYSSDRVESPQQPAVDLGYQTQKSRFSLRIPIETQSTHWSQPSWWGSIQYHRSIYDFAKIEGAPNWINAFENSAYAIGRLSFFRNQTVVEDHVAGYVNQQWLREEYEFTYKNPSLGLGIGLSSRLKNTELFAEGTFNLGSQLQTSVFKGILNNDGTQTTLESYTYDENLRFVAIAFGLRRYFAHQ